MSRGTRSVGQHNMPEDLTSLIGRERDLAMVGDVLRSHRVVSLVGVGGVGETRLALCVARAALDDFPGGVWLVELASLTDGALVAHAVAASAGVPAPRDGSVAETLIAALGPRQVLLVIDNCEHLVQACCDLVERLVRSCPGRRPAGC